MSKRRSAQSARKYVASLYAARRALADARLGLAKVTTPDGPVSLVDSRWQWAQRLLEERAPFLMRYPHVIGLGLGSKVTAGRDTEQICVTVFVGRKLRPATLRKRGQRPLPRTLRKGRRSLPVDVVQIGRLKRQAFAGQSCSVTARVTRTATIGAPAVTPLGAGVFITAMHVTGLSEVSPTSGVMLPVRAPSAASSPSSPVIGHVVEGSRNGIDAAKVVLAGPHTVLRDIPQVGRIRGWRPPVFPMDKGIPVVMFGARSQIRHTGFVVTPAAFIPGFGLDNAITVRGLQTVEGDSGAALLDRDLFLLGFLVGVAGDGLRVFCPAGLALRRLHCDIPTIPD